MKTKYEIRKAAINLIQRIVVLQHNVNSGLIAEKAELDEKIARLEGVKNWFISENQMPELKHWFANNNYGGVHQPIMDKLRVFFGA
jgi:cell division protein FtsX